MNIYQFPFQVDVSDMTAEIINNPNCWNFDTAREHSLYEQRNTRTIPLRNIKSKRGIRTPDHDDVYDTAIIPYFPATMRFINWFLETFGGECGKIAIVALKPNADVSTHFDEGAYYRARDRFHLVLQGMYSYTVDGETSIFKPGDLFWFDCQKLHSAKNIGEEDRLVLIFDVKGSNFRQESDPLVIRQELTS